MAIKRNIMLLAAAAVIFAACEKSEDTLPEHTTVPVSETSAAEASESAEETAPENSDFRYTIKDGEVKLEAYIGSGTIVAIPEYIEGCPVVRYSSEVFQDTNVTEITFPSTIKVITEIKDAGKLETINISSETEDFFPKSFISCRNLKNINAENGESFMSADGVLYSADGKTLVCFPAGRTGEFVIPEGVESIGENAFYKSSLTSVILPQSIVKINRYGFAYSELTNIEFPSSLTETGDYAFINSALKNVTLNDGLISIGTSAFANTNISEIYIPDSVEKCDNIFGTDRDSRKISAPLSAIYADGMSTLLKYENVTYRGETAVDALIRKTRFQMNNGYYRDLKNIIFTDIDGDNFPESAWVYDYGWTDWKQYDFSAGEWKYIFSAYSNFDLDLYYDKKKDEYFYIFPDRHVYDFAYSWLKLSITEDGFYSEGYGNMFGNFDCYTEGYREEYRNALGVTYEYVTEKRVDFGYLNGKYFISEDLSGFQDNFFSEAMSEYEIVNTINAQAIIDEYGGTDKQFGIITGEFSDSPQPSEYKKPLRENSETDYITIGEEKILIDSQLVYLSGEDISEENFEKLSHLPKLTTLYISGKYDMDPSEVSLKGISKLSGLGELRVYGTKIKNAAEIGKLKDLKVLEMSPDADDLSFLTSMDNLVVIEFGSTMDKPEDFFKPLYGMKNLRYLLVDCWEQNITTEQTEHIAEKAPHINVIGYKVG